MQVDHLLKGLNRLRIHSQLDLRVADDAEGAGGVGREIASTISPGERLSKLVAPEGQRSHPDQGFEVVWVLVKRRREQRLGFSVVGGIATFTIFLQVARR